MKKKTLFLSIIAFAILIIILLYISFSSESTKFCTDGNYSISYNKNINKICLGCTGSAETLELLVINPSTIQRDKFYRVDGLVESVVLIDDGLSILALLSETDGNEGTHEGKLVKMNYENGNILDQIDFTNQMPLTMVIDSNEEYVYLTAGIILEYEDNPPKVYKIRLDTFEIIDNSVCGEYAEVIEISHDNTKVYVKNGEMFPTFVSIGEPNAYKVSGGYFKINIYETEGLNENRYIELPLPVTTMKMGYDNRLFVGYDGPYEESEYGLAVVDTTTNQIIKTMKFGDDGRMGINFMDYDSVRRNLYCSTMTFGHYNSELDMYLHKPSNIILKINLDDYTYSYITPGNEHLWSLVVAHDINYCRVFCIAETNIYYFDQ